MRIKTGETRTVRMPVNIKYRCSSCGEANLFPDEVVVSDFTPAIMGITLGSESSLNQAAREALKEKIVELSDKNNLRRYTNPAFDCECEFCGHREPWANMTYPHLLIPTTISAFVFVISFFLLLISRMALFFLIVCALSASVLVGIFIYRAINNKRVMKLIPTLPPESIPILRLPYQDEDFIRPIHHR